MDACARARSLLLCSLARFHSMRSSALWMPAQTERLAKAAAAIPQTRTPTQGEWQHALTAASEKFHLREPVAPGDETPLRTFAALPSRRRFCCTAGLVTDC